ncbi:unnamed protein product [Mytilus edulis]|uniref:Uncharacterized protein n=1 Tax=Mytilus edulis TaxID=6550 RepID=A0A8S3UFG9_MYTED|nr:unnamed protein product [Mytilus edulis]
MNDSPGTAWPWNWKREDVTCYTTCLAAVGTGAVVATPVAISAAGYDPAGIAAGSLTAKLMSMVGVVKAGSWMAYLQSIVPVLGQRVKWYWHRQPHYYVLLYVEVQRKDKDVMMKLNQFGKKYPLSKNVRIIALSQMTAGLFTMVETCASNLPMKSCIYFSKEINMLLETALWIIAFTVVLLTSEVYGLDWPCHWKKEDVTHVKCYTTCLAAVRTGVVVATHLAIPAAGFGAAGIVAGPFLHGLCP